MKAIFPFDQHLPLQYIFFLNILFDVDHFKWSLLNLLQYWLYVLVVVCFWPWGMWNLSSLTKDRSRTLCVGRWSLNHWTTGKIPILVLEGEQLNPSLVTFIPPSPPTSAIFPTLCQHWLSTGVNFEPKWDTYIPGGSVVKILPANAGDAGDAGSIPGSGRSPGGGNGNSLQSSWLEKPMHRGAWLAV